MERMRQRYGLGQGGAEGTGSAVRGQAATASGSTTTRVSSLEEELEDTLRRVNIKDFDYKPVPRPEDEEAQ